MLADAGDVAVAAAALGTTPVALARTVRALERKTGEPLIVDGDRAVTLTPAGRVLQASARRVLAALDHLEGVATTDGSTMRVAHVAGADTLQMILSDAGAAGADVVESTGSAEQQLRDLLRHRIDVAICPLEAPLAAELTAEPLRIDRI